jgi:hypothetical protein
MMKTTTNKTIKTNHRYIYSSQSALTSVLTYVNPRSLAVALFVSLALLGAARGNVTGMTKSAQPQLGQSAKGALEVYSATDEFNDGGTLYYAHSSYTIYTLDGKLLKNVENHVSQSDELPETVSLPIGSYTVVARSKKDGYVNVPVKIRNGRRTIVDVDR